MVARSSGSSIKPEDLTVTVSYFGGSKGRLVPRSYAENEDPHETWGEVTTDLYINDDVFFTNVPEPVWKYELGGYPVLKKWLGNRQTSRRDGAPLALAERRWFKSMVQRIAALVALEPQLDLLYASAAVDAFTGEELGLS